MNSPLRTPVPGHATPSSSQQSRTVTVVICTRNRPALLQKCLSAVANLRPAPNQVLVIDNSEGDDDTRKVAQDYGARYIVEPRPGLSRARNRALTECDTDVLAYLDDDAIPAPDWLGLLMEPFDDEKVAASTGRVITPESRTDPDDSPRVLNSTNPHWFERTTFGGMGLGSNMALNKSACNGQIMFDERLGRGAPFQIGEENYAFARLLSLGYSAVYLPQAVVYHPSLTRDTIEHEARNSIAYWLVLFSAFPKQRGDLIRFILRRFLRKPLDWPRDSQQPGDIVTSSWLLKLKAAFGALLLYLRTPSPPARHRS